MCYSSIVFSRFFEDIELHKEKDSSKYRFKKDGKKHTFIIQEATLDDIGMYHAWTNGGHTKGELEVEGTTVKYVPFEQLLVSGLNFNRHLLDTGIRLLHMLLCCEWKILI